MASLSGLQRTLIVRRRHASEKKHSSILVSTAAVSSDESLASGNSSLASCLTNVGVGGGKRSRNGALRCNDIMSRMTLSNEGDEKEAASSSKKRQLESVRVRPMAFSLTSSHVLDSSEANLISGEPGQLLMAVVAREAKRRRRQAPGEVLDVISIGMGGGDSSCDAMAVKNVRVQLPEEGADEVSAKDNEFEVADRSLKEAFDLASCRSYLCHLASSQANLAYVNHKCSNGMGTVLHLAVLSSDFNSLFQILQLQGLDLWATNARGETAKDLAIQLVRACARLIA